MKSASPEAFQLMAEGSAAFADMETNGMRMDMPYLDRMIFETGEKIQDMEEAIHTSDEWRVWKKLYGTDAGLGKRDQLARVIFGEMGETPKKFTNKHDKSGNRIPATDQEAFEDVESPFVKNWLELAKLKDLRAKSLVGFKKWCVDGWIRPCFNLHTAVTFRSSCSDPNGQNIPNRDQKMAKIVRTAFIPRDDDYVLVEADKSGAEVRAACAYHHDPTMVQYIVDDYDMHLDMGAECYKLAKERVSKGIRGTAKGGFVFAEFYGDWYHQVCQNLWFAVDRDKLVTKDGVKLRDHLNSVGLTELGDLNPKNGAKKGSFEEHIKEVEANFWNVRFPVYTSWKNEWWEEYCKNGYYRMHTGFVSQGVFGKNEVINGPVQGTAFHWLLWSLIQLNKWLKKNKMKTKLIGQIHDSMLLDTYRKELQDVLAKIKHIITVELPAHWRWINVPLAIESSVGEKNWFDKEEFVERGGLWVPKKETAA